MRFYNAFKHFITTAWSFHSRRSCLLIFICQFVALVSLFSIGFVYVHVYVPNYNAKRLSKVPLVCSSISDEILTTCELPWNHSKITIDVNLHHKLYEEDGHSVAVSFLRSGLDLKHSKNDSKSDKSHQEQMVASERHFNWSSCGEFCEEDFVDQFGCRQIRVDARATGTDFKFEGCKNMRIMECEYLKVGLDIETQMDKERRIWEMLGRGNKTRITCNPEKDPSCLRSGIFECHTIHEDEPEDSTPATTTTLTSKATEPPTLQLLDDPQLTIPGIPTLKTTAIAPTTSTTETTSPTYARVVASSAPVPLSNSETTTQLPRKPSVTTPSTNSSRAFYIERVQPPSSAPRPGLIQRVQRVRRSIRKSSLICTRLETSFSCPSDAVRKSGGQNFNCAPSSSKSCFKSPGIYICSSSHSCTHIPNPNSVCTRNCDKILLQGANMIVTNYFGLVLTAHCDRALHKQKGFEVWPRGIKHMMDSTIVPPLMVHCNKILQIEGVQTEENIYFSDCINGTRLENSTLPDSASLKRLEELWHESMKTEDFLLDPIEQKNGAPEGHLEVYKNVPLYYNDFYKNIEGCDLPPKEKFQGECSQFYKIYGRTKGDLRGQAQFACYCRHVHKTTYCVVGDRDVFEHFWEDGIVDFIQGWYVPLLVLLIFVFTVSLGGTGLLMYPLVTDSWLGNDTTAIVTPAVHTPRGRSQLGCLTPSKSTGGEQRDSWQGQRRSRSNSIISAMN